MNGLDNVLAFFIGFSLAQAADPRRGESAIWWWLGVIVAVVVDIILTVTKAQGYW